MWKCSSCEVQGKGHILKQIPCQDKTKTSFENETYVIALSDGAGSAKLSHYGAECVVNSITKLFSNNFDDLYFEDDGRQVKFIIIEKILGDINSLSKQLSCTNKELAATMLVVAIKQDKFIIAHIGDGVIGYLDGAELKVASSPTNGEHANETYFVTSSNAINTMKLYKGNIKNIAGFVIMSDGTEQSLYNKNNNSLSPAIIKLLQRNIIVDETSMCSQLESTFKNVIITKTHDDCSIAMISRENEILHSFDNLRYHEKCDLFDVRTDGRNSQKRIMRYNDIVECLKKPSTIKEISHKIHLKSKYTKRHLEKLQSDGIVKCKNGLYWV